MLTKEEVQHIASLARIRLAEGEVEKFQKDLGTILDFVDKLKEVDTQGVVPTTQVTGVVNALRQDVPTDEQPSQGEKLVSVAPQREGRFVKVKAVFE